MANEWWNSKGDFQPLHQMNPTRCRFVRDFTCLHFGLDKMKPNALEGLEILDVGCGGGILSESVARMGAKVTGIDAVEESIEVAKAHAQHDPELASRLQYDKVSAESLAQKDKKFDVVLASEVIEHVKDPRAFVGVLESLMQPNGAVIVSTINRTPQAYLGTIVVAEYMMRLLAVGTHDFRKFITPDELAMAAQDAGLEMKHLAGMSYTPFLDRWDLKEDTSINYIAGFIKQTRAKN
ncbi:hypothetical protein BSKO_02049 [Bryopsis sp. KO-2023]|nr:hypothetical protein BSKO_02049 [Bryopsis sp. KO-2023]